MDAESGQGLAGQLRAVQMHLIGGKGKEASKEISHKIHAPVPGLVYRIIVIITMSSSLSLEWSQNVTVYAESLAH